MRITGTMRVQDQDRGVVRVEDVYATDIEDLWEACTQPDRLARWIGDVSGDLTVGGTFSAAFTSGWEGSGRVEVCDRPHRLRVITWEGSGDESTIEAAFTAVGESTRLVVEESGVPVGQLPAYGAGWQVHAEDLAAHVAGRERDPSPSRWRDPIPAYQQMLAEG